MRPSARRNGTSAIHNKLTGHKRGQSWGIFALARLFNRDERAVIVAMDHALFEGPIEGMIDLAETARCVAPCVDGILLSPAMLPYTSHAFHYKGAPMAVVRLNWSTTYCFTWHYKEAATVPAFRPAEALRLGADVVLVSLRWKPAMSTPMPRTSQSSGSCARRPSSLDCRSSGSIFLWDAENLTPEQLQPSVYRGARIISELGADLIKTFYTPNFRAVTESCPVPVLGLGAARLPTQLAALRLAAEEAAGAGGVVFGRNALQVPNPIAFQEALCDVVKRGVRPEEAVNNHHLE